MKLVFLVVKFIQNTLKISDTRFLWSEIVCYALVKKQLSFIDAITFKAVKQF